MEIDGIQAEFVRVGGVEMAKPSGYAVIVDRISHDMPFYRAYLKNAALTGTQIINNPFWWSADDKFFNYSLALKLGVAVPPTVILPHKKHPEGTTDRSMRNLEYPLNWDAVFDYVGLDVSKAIGESIGIPIPELLAALVEEGALGRKSGRGFYGKS